MKSIYIVIGILLIGILSFLIFNVKEEKKDIEKVAPIIEKQPNLHVTPIDTNKKLEAIKPDKGDFKKIMVEEKADEKEILKLQKQSDQQLMEIKNKMAELDGDIQNKEKQKKLQEQLRLSYEYRRNILVKAKNQSDQGSENEN